MYSRKKPSIRRAFTLVEMVVVAIIIAILATLVAPNVWKALTGAKRNAAKSEVSNLAKVVTMWMLDNGYDALPDDFEMEMLIEDKYVSNESKLTDPWENPYDIVYPGEVNEKFDIISYGADGEQGGEGENEDIIND